MRALLATLTLAVAGGCASTETIPQLKQDAYFSCAGVTLAQAEQNLALEGWPIGQRGSSSITSEYRPVQLPKGTEMIFFHGERYEVTMDRPGQYLVKVVVASEPDGSGVRYHVFQAIETWLNGKSQGKREGKVERILQAQIEHKSTRIELNKYRKAVCAGERYFKAP